MDLDGFNIGIRPHLAVGVADVDLEVKFPVGFHLFETGGASPFVFREAGRICGDLQNALAIQLPYERPVGALGNSCTGLE